MLSDTLPLYFSTLTLFHIFLYHICHFLFCPSLFFSSVSLHLSVHMVCVYDLPVALTLMHWVLSALWNILPLSLTPRFFVYCALSVPLFLRLSFYSSRSLFLFLAGIHCFARFIQQTSTGYPYLGLNWFVFWFDSDSESDLLIYFIPLMHVMWTDMTQICY